MKPESAPESTSRVTAAGVYEAIAYVAPVVLWCVLVWSRLTAFAHEGSYTALLSAVQMSIMAAMLTLRGQPRAADRSVSSLLAAWAGNFLPFLLVLESRNTSLGSLPLAVQTVALLLSTAAILSLRTRVSIAPGNRGICTSGLYRYARHPMYSSAILGQAAVVMEYPSLLNFTVLLAASAFKWRMIANEEKLLLRDQEYVEYCKTVRHKVIPGVV